MVHCLEELIVLCRMIQLSHYLYPYLTTQVAKCLDPHLFRNVDYLNWCEEKRDEFRTGHLVTPALDTGVKCTARIGMKEHTGFIQSIDTKANTAQVSQAIFYW